MTKNLKIIVILLLSACSLNPSSSLWTKHKDIKYEESLIIRDLGSKTFVLQKEINPNIKIRLNNKIIQSKEYIEHSNNNGVTNYDGQLKKISKYNFSKIRYFTQYEPEISLYKNNVIFFDNKGTILNFNKESKLLWKKNYYSKYEKK